MLDLKLKKGEIVSIVGAGGKTTLLNYLSNKYSKNNRVLMTTTTKIYPPKKYDYLYYNINFIYKEKLPLKNGLYVLGIKYLDKLSSLSYEDLEKIKDHFDYIFIEADGAKMKPLKGWRDDEPIIWNRTTTTIGVLNIAHIGKFISGKFIHRVDIFCKLVGKKDGDKLSLGDYRKIIESRDGMFKNSIGKRKILITPPNNVLNKILLNDLSNNFSKSSTKNSSKITGIVLASGYSSRMGKNKLLLLKDGIPMIEHLFIELLKVDFLEIIVVTQYKEVKKLAKLYDYTVIDNSNPQNGISESIKLGVKNSNETSNFMFFMGDQPFLKKKTIKKIIERSLKESARKKIIIPTILGRRKSPTIFDKIYRNNLLELSGDIGGKVIINNNLDKIITVDFNKIDDFLDVDTIEEYEKSLL